MIKIHLIFWLHFLIIKKNRSWSKTWQDYFNCLKEGEKWQVKFVQENDLTKVSLDDVKMLRMQQNSLLLLIIMD